MTAPLDDPRAFRRLKYNNLTVPNNVKPVPPQAVANGQAVCRACPAVWG
jgi:hypothetical protein